MEEESNNGCLQIDIMLLGDFSQSVNGHEKFVSGAFNAFAKRFELSEDGVKIGAIIFDSDAILISPLTSDELFLHNQLDSLTYYYEANGTTNMLGALHVAMDQFVDNGRVGYRKIIIVISDGQPDISSRVLELARQIKSLNIGICGVLVLANNNSSEFMREVSSDFCYVETDYENLILELKKLEICM
jgi:Mg-chelatase subunit ChlD